MQKLFAKIKIRNALTEMFKNSEIEKGFKMVRKILLAILLLNLTFTQLNAYDGKAAARYALKWTVENGDTHNRSYRYFRGEDCTNFASQCIEAGGIRYDRHGVYPYQFWWSNYQKMPSESWRWAPTSRKRAKYGGFDGAERIWSKNDIKIGDIIYFDWNQDAGDTKISSIIHFTHTTIVTKITYSWRYSWSRGFYKKPNVYVTYHSTHRVNKSLDYLIGLSDRWECYRPGGK